MRHIEQAEQPAMHRTIGRGQAVVRPSPVLADKDQPGTTKRRKVSRHGRLRQFKHVNQIAHAHLAAAFTLGQTQQREQPKACRVGERTE